MDEGKDEKVLDWSDWEEFKELLAKLENLPKGERNKLRKEWLEATFKGLAPRERKIARRMLRNLESLKGLGRLGSKELLARLGVFLCVVLQGKEKASRKKWFQRIWKNL